jgi:hypothetical protein
MSLDTFENFNERPGPAKAVRHLTVQAFLPQCWGSCMLTGGEITTHFLREGGTGEGAAFFLENVEWNPATLAGC